VFPKLQRAGNTTGLRRIEVEHFMTDMKKEIKAGPQQQRNGPAGQPQRNGPAQPKVVVFDQPVAQPATIKKRHKMLLLGLGLVIGLPVLVVAIYLIFFAQPQYTSEVGFTIRQEETTSSSDIMGGLSGILGNPAQSNADLLFEYMQSQEIVQKIAQKFDVTAHFAQNWPLDPVFSIWPDATIEDLHWYWNRIARITYDQASGLMLVKIRANTPEAAQTLARMVVAQSEQMINGLNETARIDATRNSEADLQAALERLRAAREELAHFRARTQILDPQADIQGRMGVLNVLQQQLAETLVEYDLLIMQSDGGNDPRLGQLERRIEVIRNRIDEERRLFTQQNVTVDQTDYPSLIAQYESLLVDQTFAEATYQAALTAADAARSNADRQTLYLATFIQPSLAQSAQHPQTVLLILLTAMFSTLAWAIMALIYYSLRDRG
jgi:capsular polysaccharide transport system permease protein